MTIDYWLADAKFLFLGHRNLTAKDDFPILDKIVAFQISATSQSSVNPKGKHLYTVTRRLWFWFLIAVGSDCAGLQGGWEGKAPPRGGGLKLLQCFYRAQEGTIYFCSLAAHPKGYNCICDIMGVNGMCLTHAPSQTAGGAVAIDLSHPWEKQPRQVEKTTVRLAAESPVILRFYHVGLNFFFFYYYYFSRIEKYMFVRYIFLWIYLFIF